ncbi:MAG: cytochrome C oxidase subunit IV family protein [Chloroflexi bacterium]|nr:cytochrome C oxidase subunit IV family protein [Chloroflexota bacterium]
MSTASHVAPSHADAHEAESHHPSARFYLAVGGILAVITAVEVWIYTIESMRPILAPTLLVLSAAKFTMVVAFFMHLRFDNRMLTYMFAFGLMIAAGVITALILMFGSTPLPQLTTGVPSAPAGH